ncbi:transposon ty3-I gag-pol polyprotein [Tanacetum coccineum]
MDAGTGTLKPASLPSLVVEIVANKYKLHILVDSGSTHNFLDINVAKRMGCKIIPISPVSITMAGGKQLVRLSECKGFTWQLKGKTFVTHVLLLPLGGCEMVLGIQWLATLGDIKCNFKALRMEFAHNNKKLVIRGTPKSLDEWLPGKKRVQRMDPTQQAEIMMMWGSPNTDII